MTRRSAVLLTLAALLALPATADARVSPTGFMGMNADGLTFDGGPKLAKGISAMRKRGVGSLRVTFYWSEAQPYAQMSDVPPGRRDQFVKAGGRPTNFGPADAVVAAAVRKGISVLPVVIAAPRWASTQPGMTFAPPKNAKDFARFTSVLVRRYGPKGSFWTDNPSIPKRPIRDWQIWNEPAGFLGFGDRTLFWTEPFSNSLPVYVGMLKASRTSIKKADKGARIVLAGFYGRPWLTMDQIYKAGARKLFDVVTIHPYASNVSDSLRILSMVRDVMRDNGDKRKPLMVTELTWTSAAGKLTNTQGLDYIIKTESQQASLLRSAYRNLWAKRSKLRLLRAYWYTWGQSETSSISAFNYSGLYRIKASGSAVAKPAAGAYSKVAAEIRKG